MKKLIILTLGLTICSGLMVAKAPKESANIVRIKNACKQHAATIIASYPGNAINNVTTQALSGKEVDFVYTSDALGGTVQNIKITYPTSTSPVIISQLEKGKEYLVNIDNENWEIRNIK
ncbi:hypothetical protein [Methylicorpusculum sp.]|uniref:hypothetical protein n=1 Tax=Methylicorpusculum sp. TaxID=2713644 RepID=UPI002ABC505D|nr:hypothetical protein [Methylicorpusculum sp.]MDZ4149937.1 hypothetical protein [Methylicorpusculum sp.]